MYAGRTVFAQLIYRKSLRDIETCLRSMHPRLYHLGFRSEVSRSTLAQANEQRDGRIYAHVAQVLMRQARQLYAREEKMEVKWEETASIASSSPRPSS
jgi:hypothetical protein